MGRNNRGEVVGVPDASRLLEELPNKVRDLLGIIVEVDLRSEGGREYLEIVTPAYPSPISYRGHYYQRSGSTLQELKGAALDRFLLRRYGRTWDGAPLPGVAVKDLSRSATKRFRQLAANSDRLNAAALREPDNKLLTRLKLFEDKYLKRAAVLLFHPDALAFVTGAFVKIGFFRSQSDLVYHDEVNGDLFSQVQQTQDLLLTKYLKAAVTYEGIVRVERFPVPREALREAVLNALIHRDYMVPVSVQIRVYDDKLVLWNPAVLPEGWTQKTLLAPHQSHPPNPDLANTFFRAGEIESHYLWGRRHLLTVVYRETKPFVSLDHKRITLTVRPGSDVHKCADVIHEWHKSLLHAMVPPLIKKWEPKLKVKVAAYFLQRMKTKWGSCNHRAGHIRLNTELVKKPKDLLEYVVVHEMMHLIEPTHSERYASLLTEHYPTWRERPRGAQRAAACR